VGAIQRVNLSSECRQISENDAQEDWSLPDIMELDNQPNTIGKVDLVHMHEFPPLTEQEEEIEDVWNIPHPPEADNNDRAEPNGTKKASLLHPTQTERAECESFFRYGAHSPSLIADFFNIKRGRALDSEIISSWLRGMETEPSIGYSTFGQAPQSILKYRYFLYEQRVESIQHSERIRKIEEEIQRIETLTIPIINKSNRLQDGESPLRGYFETLSKYSGACSHKLIVKFLGVKWEKSNRAIIEKWHEEGSQTPVPCLARWVKQQLILDYLAFLHGQWRSPSTTQAAKNIISVEMTGVMRHVGSALP